MINKKIFSSKAIEKNKNDLQNCTTKISLTNLLNLNIANLTYTYIIFLFIFNCFALFVLNDFYGSHQISKRKIPNVQTVKKMNLLLVPYDKINVQINVFYLLRMYYFIANKTEAIRVYS